MARVGGATWLLALVAFAPLAAPRIVLAQESQQNLPAPVPPPLPPPPPPEDPDAVPENSSRYGSISPEADGPWGLEAALLAALKHSSDLYLQYSRRFICDETARLADYDGSGDVSHEDVRHYGYLLLSGDNEVVSESRQLRDRKGGYKPGEVEDSEPFPPAYAWVFLFGQFHEPYFSFRKLDTYFEGFDLVHEIQFRGSISFTDGKDIRQWEGVVLVDAFKLVPVAVRAEPVNQAQRLEEAYRQWAQAFNIIGLRLKSPPLGHRAHIDFGYRRDGLSFPTDLRYDTFRAVSPRHVVPVRASTRVYRDYRFTGASPGEEVFDTPAAAEGSKR